MTPDIASSRPELLSLTRAVNALIFTDLVATQPTKNPKATLFGLRYLNPDNTMTFQTATTYAGKYGDRTGIDKLTITSSFEKDKVFVHNDAVYQAIDAVDFSSLSGESLKDKVFTALIGSKIRMVTDAADVSYLETLTAPIQEVKFNLDRWSIDTKVRKYKTLATTELIQDLNANDIDGEAVIHDMLVTTLSEEINKDIMQKLQTVSKRHISTTTPEGILNLTGASDDPTFGRTVYRMVSEMAYEILSDTTFEANYVLCTPAIAGFLSSSGWMKGDPDMTNLYTGILANGIKVYIDGVSEYDYLVVGTKQYDDELESASSLFYSPFVDVDESGSYTVAVDPADFNNRIMCMARYGLSVNPYTAETDIDNRQIYEGDNWNALAAKSKYSRLIGIQY